VAISPTTLYKLAACILFTNYTAYTNITEYIPWNSDSMAGDFESVEDSCNSVSHKNQAEALMQRASQQPGYLLQ
jgi:hypothetical protein